MIADFPTPSAVEFWSVLGVALFAMAAYKLFLDIQVDRKKLAAPAPTNQRDVQQPLIVKGEAVFITEPLFNQKITELQELDRQLRTEMDGRFEHTEAVFRDRFHKLDNDLNAINLEARHGRDIATEQFQKIEGRIGELKSTTEHTNALAIRTDHAVRQLAADLPKEIANAVRSRKT
jgi:hypothetical protein